MADLSHLPDEVVYALRTGKIPPSLVDPDEELQNSDDANRFRERYHALVAEAVEDWLDENPDYGRNIPADIKERIEEDCNRHIQHEWNIYTRNQTESSSQDEADEEDEWRNPW
ncbi:Uncharacterised protein [Mycobacteroides abscessus subsp. abscessus]|uniref:hypothetical protein n=1 Tax=Mycobacteroides abscessus TaxID=36809 RepID=UPI000927559D|nr:hypothetical protein [Mycobacteroides abscessus]SHT15905.1 Uncharacterised protein [Mycobacteroides abscessus subsp. abscessus]SHU41347.1 Uncharacterised protein [Mycobacteroides abscessus subsp. abscessus]SHU44903.1 Uncharacterised protein [Mycobacteroides abscessus subsp. abscessus]SHX88385.1 Uncharacterised protein [Mycobacteroides abscessus subsp. abscessus]SIA94189.1 Uncharacterised protein [Mycobacteroides abscessus subsp. abscessus]